jgi:putative membrane protein
MNLEIFPPINATLNGLAFICLSIGYYFIRFRNDQKMHQRFMVGAFTVSALFLVCYLTYHYLKDGVHTRFAGEGFFLYFYYVMLISHILLAIVNLPLILVTVWLAIRRRFEVHRKWARWTFPIWYYVSITGVLVYFFLYQWFPGGERI